jgi:phosphoesterase RecJ-like protein
VTAPSPAAERPAAERPATGVPAVGPPAADPPAADPPADGPSATGPSATGPSGAGLPAAQARAAALINGAEEVCLACHVRPDADALGSMLALAHALRRPGRRPQRVTASFGDQPFEVPEILRFLPGLDLLTPPGDYPSHPELMITFDAGSIDRLGLLAGPAARAGHLVVIDHHASNTRFGHVNLVDPGAAATAVLVLDLIGALGAELTRDVALGLYAGLVTDTGSFKFSTTTPAVHQVAARLLATGIEPAAVGRQLWDSAPFGYLGLLADVLARAVLETGAAGGRGLVWTTVSAADRAAHGVSLDAVEPVIDVVRRTEEADVAVVLKQTDDGLWQVSARSRGMVDVGRACARLGGGGHRNAAGFTGSASADETMARLRDQLAGG